MVGQLEVARRTRRREIAYRYVSTTPSLAGPLAVERHFREVGRFASSWRDIFLGNARIQSSRHHRNGRLTCLHLEDYLPMAILCRSEEHTSELQSPCNLVCRL